MAAGPAVGIGAFLEIAAGAASAYPKVQKVINGLGATHEFLGKISKDASIAKNQMMSMLNAIGGKWVEMQDIAFKTGRTMAMSREMAMRYDRMLMQSTKDLARQYGITAKEIANFQEEYGKATGRNIILTQEQIKSMAALSKITDSATAAQLVDEFDKLGLGIEGSTAKIGLMQERAKALGINATKATQALKDNIKLAASYSFKGGVNDIEKMALKATSMRMDMNAITNAMDKFMDIEGAIGTSANLQMLGGSFAANFSNPMGAMYEAMADPKAFQDRLLKTVKGKGRYDEKTGTVQFDPVTMMTLREAAKQLGMSVEQLTNPAMADVQNEKVVDELRKAGKESQWTPKQIEAIQNLSRTNVDEKTGKHYVTLLDENGEEQRVEIENLTEEQLKIAQDSQKTEEQLFSDVQDIKKILEDTFVRARGTTSTKENIEGLGAEWDAFAAQLQNTFMPLVSGWMNGQSFQPWDLFKKSSYRPGRIDIGSHGAEGFGNISDFFGFAEGGIVEPIPHAAMGTIIPGDSTIGDKTPVMANAGEMILNQREQRGLFDILKSIATTGAMMYGGNKIGKMFGLRGLGLQMGIGNLLSGGRMGIGGMLGQGVGMIGMNKMFRSGIMPIGMNPMMPMGGFNRPFTFMNPTVMMNGETIMNGSIADGDLVEKLEDVADAAELAGKSTRSFSQRLGSLARKKTLMGSLSRGYIHARTKRRAIGRKISGSKFFRTRKAEAQLLNAHFKDWISNKRDWLSDSKLGKATKNFIADTKSLFGNKSVSSAVQATESIVPTTKAVGNSGKLLGTLGKSGKLLGRAAGGIGAVLAIGSTISDISAASSQYDAQISAIERSGMSERDKARAKDMASKEKNRSIGGSVGGLGGGIAGAAAGAAIGSVIPGIGTLIGGAIGGLIGGFGGDALGKGIGGLFGGGEEKKFIEEEREKAKAIAGDNEEIIKVLKSIEGKMPTGTKVGDNFGLKVPELESSVIRSIGSIGKHVAIKATDTVSNIIGAATGADKQKIELNVSGTIKLEGAGKSVDLDFNKLLNNPEFVRKLTETISSRMRAVSDSGKPKGGNGNYDMSKINK